MAGGGERRGREGDNVDAGYKGTAVLIISNVLRVYVRCMLENRHVPDSCSLVV